MLLGSKLRQNPSEGTLCLILQGALEDVIFSSCPSLVSPWPKVIQREHLSSRALVIRWMCSKRSRAQGSAPRVAGAGHQIKAYKMLAVKQRNQQIQRDLGSTVFCTGRLILDLLNVTFPRKVVTQMVGCGCLTFMGVSRLEACNQECSVFWWSFKSSGFLESLGKWV